MWGRLKTPVRLAGRLVVLHSDDFVSGAESEHYAVQLANGTMVDADIASSPAADAMVGRDVELVADAHDTSLVTRSGPGSTSYTASAPAAVQQTAVVLFNFTNDTSEPWTTSTVNSTVFGATGSVAAYYREVSNGASALQGTVVGWVTVPYSNSNCAYSTWSNAATAAAHVDLTPYQHVVFAFPHTTCTWAGLSTIGGKYSWINGAMTVRTVGHELAHEMGVHHASALNCTSNGVRVAFSSTCTRHEYGDPFSIMGTGTRHLTNLELAQIGWLTDIQTLTTSGYYTLAPADASAPTRLLRVARGDGTYLYFELREASGAYDTFPTGAPATRGVTVRIAPDISSRVQSLLIDTTPGTLQYDDASLTVGHSFTDPVSQVTITTTAASTSGATIAVIWPDSALVAPSPTPTASPTATPTSSPTVKPSPTPSPTPQPTPTPTPTQPPTDPSNRLSPSPTPSPTPTATPPAVTNNLTAPTPVKAVRTYGRNVRLTWSASLGPVVAYRIYFNGTWIGRTTSLWFHDWVPRDVHQATYVVRAIGPTGQLGPRARVTLVLP